MNAVHVSKTPAPRRKSPAALGSVADLRGALVPKQLRSVAVLQRIASAGLELLLAREYETVPVADIAAAAGVSVGTFYTKFPSKDHLAVYLAGDVADLLRDRMEGELAEERWVGAGIEHIIGTYVRLMAESFREYRGILRPATMIARQSDSEQLRDLLSRFNRDIHGRFRHLLMSRQVHIARPDPATAINLMILMVSAAMREVLLYGEPVSQLAPAHQQLLSELTVAAVSYLSHS